MLRVSIIVFGVLATRAEGGCDQQLPGEPFHLPHQNYQQQKTILEQHIPNAVPQYDGIDPYTFGSQQSSSQSLYRNEQVHNPGFQANHVLNHKANYNSGNNQLTTNHFNNNGGLQFLNNNQFNYNTANNQAVAPIITKHIYFHVPPPDVEEKPVVPVKTKKIYNIVFIKVPSQQTRYSAILQQTVSHELAPVEDRTLIYVLVRKPDDQRQISSPSKPNHEVFYVKYKGISERATTQMNNGLARVNSVQSLQPGLVNGRN